MAVVPEHASYEVREFCARYPIDEEALSYLMNCPPEVHLTVARDFRPKTDGEADYSALVISFSKRCRLLAAQKPGHSLADGLGGDDSADLEAFRNRFPMDDRAFSSLQDLQPHARRQVLDTFVPKRMDDTDYSAPVMAYVKVCRARAAESAAHTALHMSGPGPVSQQTVDDFCGRFPMDARALEMLLAAPPVVQTRVMSEFRPKREGDSDYSAAVVAFLGVCKRSAMGGVGGFGGSGPGPPKRPRHF